LDIHDEVEEAVVGDLNEATLRDERRSLLPFHLLLGVGEGGIEPKVETENLDLRMGEEVVESCEMRELEDEWP
jgi:hypothetical protein